MLNKKKTKCVLRKDSNIFLTIVKMLWAIGAIEFVGFKAF